MQSSRLYKNQDRVLRILLISSLVLMIPFVTSWTGISNIALVVILYAIALYLYYPVAILDSFTFALVLNIIYIIVKSVFETSSIEACLEDLKRYLPIIISYTILCHIKLTQDRNLVYFMLITLFLRYISAIVVDLVLPNTARMIAGLGTENPSTYYKIGAGSYSLINSGFLLIIPLSHCLKYSKKSKYKLFIYIFLFTDIVSAIVTNWATAIIFSFLAILIAILLQRKTDKAFIIAIVLLLCVFLINLNIGSIVREFEASSINNPQLNERLSDIIYSLAGIDNGGDLSSRVDLYSVSINSIRDNIIVGSIKAPIGGHAFFIDYAARYGLIGVMLLALVYASVLKLSMLLLPQKCRIAQVFNFVLYISFGCVKNIIGYEFLLNLFVLGPLSIYTIELGSNGFDNEKNHLGK